LKFPEIDLSRVRTSPLSSRRSKVDRRELGRPLPAGATVKELLESLPDVLAGRELRAAAAELARRRLSGGAIVLGMGAHPIKVGLSPLVVDLLERRVLAAVAMNGAGIIHDFEMALVGRTSEEVAEQLADGSFGMSEETGRFLNEAAREGAASDLGLGQAVGRKILAEGLPNASLSILAAGARLDVPVTVHVAVGTDVVHMHPTADGAAIGSTSLRDFRILAEVVTGLEKGAFVNLGSAVIVPEVFLKALNLARNVGSTVDDLFTLDMDFNRHYRPLTNVVVRPTLRGGRGLHLTGHHEIMFPLLCAALREEMERP
jgi:deoxyhypusine synthase